MKLLEQLAAACRTMNFAKSTEECLVSTQATDVAGSPGMAKSCGTHYTFTSSSSLRRVRQ